MERIRAELADHCRGFEFLTSMARGPEEAKKILEGDAAAEPARRFVVAAPFRYAAQETMLTRGVLASSVSGWGKSCASTSVQSPAFRLYWSRNCSVPADPGARSTSKRTRNGSSAQTVTLSLSAPAQPWSEFSPAVNSERTVDALRDFPSIARGSRVRDITAVATSAQSEAANGPAFIRRVRRQPPADGIDSLRVDDGCHGKRHSGVRPRNYSWAELSKRVFAADFLGWGRCGGRMRIVAAIHAPQAIRKLLECLGLPPRFPPIAVALTGDPGELDHF